MTYIYPQKYDMRSTNNGKKKETMYLHFCCRLLSPGIGIQKRRIITPRKHVIPTYVMCGEREKKRFTVWVFFKRISHPTW